jgi:hypothetical protein
VLRGGLWNNNISIRRVALPGSFFEGRVRSTHGLTMSMGSRCQTYSWLGSNRDICREKKGHLPPYIKDKSLLKLVYSPNKILHV